MNIGKIYLIGGILLSSTFLVNTEVLAQEGVGIEAPEDGVVITGVEDVIEDVEEIVNKDVELNDTITEDEKSLLQKILDLLKQIIASFKNALNFLDRENLDNVEESNEVVLNPEEIVNSEEVKLFVENQNRVLNEKMLFYVNRINDEQFIKEIEISELKAHLEKIKGEVVKEMDKHPDKSTEYILLTSILNDIEKEEEKLNELY